MAKPVDTRIYLDNELIQQFCMEQVPRRGDLVGVEGSLLGDMTLKIIQVKWNPNDVHLICERVDHVSEIRKVGDATLD